MKETTKAALRRLHEPGFVSMYFVGVGIDIGAGIDGLSKMAHLYPRMAACMDWDLSAGDAQALHGLPDASFDFVHSSHCLEHMVDPLAAIKNWFRVLKPGGHLVVVVPDEDLYEQGAFPSVFNADHKCTFTIHKTQSWSPKSYNVVDVIASLGEHTKVLKIELLEHSYDYRYKGVDQTLEMAESAIEFIVRKI